MTAEHATEIASGSALFFPGHFAVSLSDIGNIIIDLGIIDGGLGFSGASQSGGLFAVFFVINRFESPVHGVVLTRRVHVRFGFGTVNGLIFVIADHDVRVVHVFQGAFEEFVRGDH